mmetsp:Transcript_58110/g.189245  ORF Transcript_58110/g.189245 Transcript_58110/m.189245 type:complete len:214 (+) Transcript_58110:46-687(+)
MGKRQALPSCSDSEESDPAAKRKKEGKKDKEKDSKDKGKDKAEKTDKDKGKDKDKKDKDKDKKDKNDKKEKKAERAVEGPAAPPGSSQDKAKKEKKSKDAGPPTKEVFFSGLEAFNKPTHPFGLELDGGLVVDLAGGEGLAGGLALAAGVQIGWRVLSVDGNAVSEEEVGVAAELLRAAEEKMAKDGTKVVVRFVTDEPEHWKQASNKLAGRR